MTNAKPTLLFVCVHNAGRSQFAAGASRRRWIPSSALWRPEAWK